MMFTVTSSDDECNSTLLVSAPVASALATVKAKAASWLLLPDGGLAVEVLLAAVIANRLDGDPFWLFLVNPPSGTKTELIRALDPVPDVYPLSDLTPQTLLSGYNPDKGRNKDKKKREEKSLLLKLNARNKCLLTLKDFTTILSGQDDVQKQILGQLREVYDGSYRKTFGTGEEVTWDGKLGLIAGVTPYIDRASAVHQTLGERFVYFRIRSVDRIEVAKRALKNQGKETEMRHALQRAAVEFLAGVSLAPVVISEQLEERIAHLADFCAVARSNAIRGNYGREIEYIPEPEGPGRLAKQLALFGKALSLIRGKTVMGEEEYHVLYRIVWDSIHPHKAVLLDLLQSSGEATVDELVIASHLPKTTVRRYLEELVAFGLVGIAHTDGHAEVWGLSSDTDNVLAFLVPRQIPSALAA